MKSRKSAGLLCELPAKSVAVTRRRQSKSESLQGRLQVCSTPMGHHLVGARESGSDQPRGRLVASPLSSLVTTVSRRDLRGKSSLASGFVSVS